MSDESRVADLRPDDVPFDRLGYLTDQVMAMFRRLPGYADDMRIIISLHHAGENSIVFQGYPDDAEMVVDLLADLEAILACNGQSMRVGFLPGGQDPTP